eukprot:scaffold31957_cov17-Tisochrysis_lutea.AAC.1
MSKEGQRLVPWKWGAANKGCTQEQLSHSPNREQVCPQEKAVSPSPLSHITDTSRVQQGQRNKGNEARAKVDESNGDGGLRVMEARGDEGRVQPWWSAEPGDSGVRLPS